VAIEVKISGNIQKKELNGLLAYCEEHKPKKAYVVSILPQPRKITINNIEILILPWEIFL